MEVKIQNNLVYGFAAEECKLDLYLPEGDNFDTIVYFHGGGLEGGHKDDYYYVDMAKSFAKNGYGFASVEYRKYPNAKFPDFLEDCALATAVFGPSLELICVIVINIITNVFMNVVGPGLVSGEKQRLSVKRLIFNPMLIAFLWA